MARGGLDFEGIGQKNVTVLLADGIDADNIGQAMTWTDDGEVGLGNDGDPLAGKLIQVDGDGYGTLAYTGFLQLPCANNAEPDVGKKVVVNGQGGVKADPGQEINEGGSAEVTVISEGRGIVVSVDDANNLVWVQL